MLQNAPREHSAILSTFIKLPFVFKTFVLSFLKWPLKTGFTVLNQLGLNLCLSPFISNHTLCMEKVKALRSLHSHRLNSPELSLLKN